MFKTLFYRHRGQSPFRNQTPVQHQFADVMTRPLPELRYAVFFTPRSGSSHLTDLISGTGAMGSPDEVFNHRLAHGIASAMGSGTVEDYVERLVRARNVGGVFGAELTWPDMLNMFRDPERFIRLVRPDRFIWLTREDIIAQAVSIMAMTQTGVSHTKHTSPDHVVRSQTRLQYNGWHLRRIINRVIWAEHQTENFFRKRQIQPLRLSYENFTSAPPEQILKQLAGHLGVELQSPKPAASGHRQLSGEKNRQFAQRFRAENRRFVAKVDHRRAILFQTQA